MRAAFQILAIPYRIIGGSPVYCVFHRADCDQWQFIAGGGEDNETPLESAKRETLEDEHTECVWLSYDEATEKLKWDSNRTALYELNCRLNVK